MFRSSENSIGTVYYYDDLIHSQSRKRKLERRHEAQHRDPYDPRVKHQSMKIKENPEQNFDKLHERKIQVYQLRYSHKITVMYNRTTQVVNTKHAAHGTLQARQTQMR